MAATLIHIKSQMLLPRPDPAQTRMADEEDPREALVRRLLEHQKYKAAAELLHEREIAARRAVEPARRASWRRSPARRYEPELEVDLFSLMAAFRGVLERARAATADGALPPEQIPIEARIEQLLSRLSETEACGFDDLFADGDGAERPDRHVPGAARDDSAEAGAGVPVRSASARSASTSARVPPTRRTRSAIGAVSDRSRLEARRCLMTDTKDRFRSEAALIVDDPSRRIRSAEVKADRRGADLRVARTDHAERLMPHPVGGAEGRRAGGARGAEADYERPGGLQLVEVAGGYQIVTRPELHEWVRRLFHERTTQKLTVAGARDAGGDRLQAADHRAGDRGDPRRQHGRRPQHAARAAPRSRSSAASRSSAGRSCTRRRRSS